MQGKEREDKGKERERDEEKKIIRNRLKKDVVTHAPAYVRLGIEMHE